MNITSNYNYLIDLFNAHPIIMTLLIIWGFVWKALALWKAASLQHKYWFGFILVLNTLGVLEIFYLFVIARKYKVEVVKE